MQDRSGSDSIAGSATATRSARRASRRSRREGVPVDRAPFDKDESDTELAVRAALDRRPAAIAILGALGGPRLDHALANLALLALPELRGVDVRLVAADARVRLLATPYATGSVELDGRVGDLVTLLPVGADAIGVTTAGLAYPLRGETLVPRPLARPVEPADARPTGRRPAPMAGRLLVVETPATLSAMSIPAVGDPAPRVALPDATGTIHDLADQRGRWTILYFYPKDDTPGCTVEACEFRDANETITERGADVWGISPAGRRRASGSSREKFGLPFTLLADEDHRGSEAYGSWVEKQNYGKTYMGTARRTFLIDPEGRIARVWEKVKPEGHAADVLAALDELQATPA